MNNKKNWGIFLFGVLDLVLILILIGLLIRQNDRINKLEVTNKSLQITQGKNIAELNKDEIVTNIRRYILTNPAPEGLLFAMRKWENGYPGHEYGAKKTFPDLKKDQQLGTATRIIQQEMAKFVTKYRKEFVKHLALRYNKPKAKTWSEGVYIIWKEYDEEKKK